MEKIIKSDWIPKNIDWYYREENIAIACGDCLEVMKELPDKSIDLVLTDPPYGIEADKMQMGSGFHRWDKKINDWDDNIPSLECFNELFRVSKNQVIWGGNYFANILPPSANWLIWDKLNPNLSFSEAEMAWVRYGQRIRIFKKYSANQIKYHPTQKPLVLMTWSLANYSKDNDTILDPFLGSGTTARACKNLGRKCIGIEISQKYCDIAIQRLSQEVFNFNQNLVKV